MRIALVLSLLLAAFATNAHAQTTCAAPNGDCVFNWTPPTQYDNGTPLSASQIAGYRFVCTLQSTGAAVAQPSVTGALSTATRRFQPGGPYVCALITQDIFGSESVPSNSVVFQVARPNPAAPAGLSVN